MPALISIQVRVARATRQAIGFAHDGTGDNLHREIQIAHHTADHRQLRGVLLSEERSLGLKDVKQLRDDGRHAAEMARPRSPVELFAQAFDHDPGAFGIGIGFGIDLFDRRREENPDAFFFEQPAVAVERARIFCQIFFRAELRWVHEDGNSDRVALRSGRANQRQMALMQSTHGRHQAQALAAGSYSTTGGATFRNGRAYLHGESDLHVRSPDDPITRSPDDHPYGVSRYCTSSSLRVPRSKARFFRTSALSARLDS